MNIRIKSLLRLEVCSMIFFMLLGIAISKADAASLTDFPLLNPSGTLFGDCGPVPKCFAGFADLQGKHALVSASGQLSIFVKQPSGEWTLDAALLDPFAPEPRPFYNSGFGFLASIDGNVLAVAAAPENSPLVYMFVHRDGVWSLTQTIHLDGTFGQLFLDALKVDNGTLLISQLEISNDMVSRSEAKVLVYAADNTGQFNHLQDLNPATDINPSESYRVAIERNTLVLSTSANDQTPGAVFVYEKKEFARPASQWRLHQVIQPDQLKAAANFGDGIAISADRIAISAPGIINPAPTLNPGAIFIYQHHNQRWKLQDKIVDPVTESDTAGDSTPPSANPFGTLFALSGRRLLVKHITNGFPGFGSDILFERQNRQWIPTARISEVQIQSTLLSHATALVAETDNGAIAAFLNIYDLPSLHPAVQDADEQVTDQ